MNNEIFFINPIIAEKIEYNDGFTTVEKDAIFSFMEDVVNTRVKNTSYIVTIENFTELRNKTSIKRLKDNSEFDVISIDYSLDNEIARITVVKK